MEKTMLSQLADHYLNYLCTTIPNRRVGTVGNRAAASFIADQFQKSGFSIETPTFDCLDWSQDGAQLSVAEIPFEVQVSPFSLGCQVQAELVVAATLDELEQVQAEGKILLLSGELAKVQLMPKNFPFYNPEEHKEIIRLVEGSHPAALVCATGRNPELAAAIYPFPLFEDGDFNIPSVFMTEVEGARLVNWVNQTATLDIRAQRSPATGCNVIARKGAQAGKRLVLTAHFDTKDGTPGALDNAAGVTTLLLLAELLQGFSGTPGVEIVAINGEDHYAAPGEIQYIRMNVETLKDIYLNINLDGLGYREGNTAFSMYQCQPALESHIRQVLGTFPGLTEGEAWYQGDHMVFVQNDLPALAFTSEQMAPLWAEIAHTPKDLPELVDGEKLVEVALALQELITLSKVESSELC